jgi:hypothetical protein
MFPLILKLTPHYLLLPKTCSTAFMTGTLKFFSSLQSTGSVFLDFLNAPAPFSDERTLQ